MSANIKLTRSMIQVAHDCDEIIQRIPETDQ